MTEEVCEGCNKTDELTYNRYAQLMLCDWCYESACEEEDQRNQEDDDEYYGSCGDEML